MDIESFEKKDLEYSQNHLRLISGLYGLLKPLDIIEPYRLEMGTKLKTSKGKNLYEFWDKKPTQALNKQLTSLDSSTVINLASNEYFNAVDKSVLKANIITPVFKDYKNGKYKIISFYAKKARGLMSAYIIKNKLSEPSQIKKFNVDGYYFEPQESTKNEWLFLRNPDTA